MMTLDEFQRWLDADRSRWIVMDEEPGLRSNSGEITIAVPEMYTRFLKRFGSIMLYDHFDFLGPGRMAQVKEFMVGLNWPDDGVFFNHLTPFCDTHADCCYFCFDGEVVVEFDPMEPWLPERMYSPSLGDFLAKIVSEYP